MEQLLLSCRALSSPTLCRFIPALSQRPQDHLTHKGNFSVVLPRKNKFLSTVVTFSLTHKGNFSIVLPRKNKFLSTVVTFSLTHKGNFSIVLPRKNKFLSTVVTFHQNGKNETTSHAQKGCRYNCNAYIGLMRELRENHVLLYKLQGSLKASVEVGEWAMKGLARHRCRQVETAPAGGSGAAGIAEHNR